MNFPWGLLVEAITERLKQKKNNSFIQKNRQIYMN